MKITAKMFGMYRFMLGIIAVCSALTPFGLLRAAPDDFQILAAKLLPAVVNISVVQSGPATQDDFSGSDSFLKDWFDGDNQPGFEEESESLGSGFIIDPTGYIVTNHHVIEGATRISVRLYDNRVFQAKLIGADPKTDLALLKIESSKPFPFVPWGDSEKTKIGEWIMAIGNPFGLGGSVSIGIISASQRNIHNGPYDDYLQTDAAINQGNSGGPMFNMRGEVIGINTAIISPSGGSVGLGFAISANLARDIIDQLRQNGRVLRGWIGVNIQSVSDDMAASLGLAPGTGALVSGVVANSPAEKAGLKKGDVIAKINNRDLTSARLLPRMVAALPIGSKIPVDIFRNKTPITLQLDVQELPEKTTGDTTSTTQQNAGVHIPELGLIVSPLDANLRRRFDIPKQVQGLVILNVESGSVTAQKGLKTGDVVHEINQKPIRQANDIVATLKEAQEKGHKVLTVLIIRQGDYQWVALTTPPVGSTR
ncbi:MAG: Do family serine endopeptidase [Alphaproteobacteria bacterium]|nr:Do family serine endopeptidase [Alphaproteobacteria bacterium]